MATSTLTPAPRITLRPYQRAILRAVTDSALRGHGLVFTVEMARQGGKNEVSAHLEAFLLAFHVATGGNLIKAAPTFVPQLQTSIQRLKALLHDFPLDTHLESRHGYEFQFGLARILFLSANDASNVVGATAHHLLEIDEAQDVDKAKF